MFLLDVKGDVCNWWMTWCIRVDGTNPPIWTVKLLPAWGVSHQSTVYIAGRWLLKRPY